MTALYDGIACPECDLLMEMPVLEPGQQARCPQCDFVLTTCRSDPFGRALGFAIAGLVVLAISLSFPFLTISSNGIENTMTLSQTVSYLADYDAQAIAFLVLVFVILAPCLLLIANTSLAIMLKVEWFPEWMLPVTRWGYRLNTWSMVEVFSIGVIVSLVKISAMAKVNLGISFWAYLAFTVLFLLSSSALDRLTVWSTIKRLRSVA